MRWAAARSARPGTGPGSAQAGAATVTDDTSQGREASLAASLNYGFTHAFSEPERVQLALLSLFQGFIDIDTLIAMGSGTDAVPTVAGLTREAGIAVLDRAAEAGVLTAHGGGLYDVHPAIPWHFHHLFEQHYGRSDGAMALHATYAWAQTLSQLGDFYYGAYFDGRTEVIARLRAEKANLLQARRLALTHGWHELVIGTMQGLNILFTHTGRTIEWRRLVEQLIPVFTDSVTSGPRAGMEDEWAMLISYQVRIANQARDWTTAQRLQSNRIASRRQEAAAALATPADQLSDKQHQQIRGLAAALHDLGESLREQGDAECVEPYQEAGELSRRVGEWRGEATVALNLGHAYKDIPALRDLDQAEHWYKHRLGLIAEHDVLSSARTRVALGNVAYERFKDAHNAGAPDEQLLGYLNDAADAYKEALEQLPADEINEHAVAHNQLGCIYAAAGHTDRALDQYRKTIHYHEQQANRYRAGQARYNAAAALANAGRNGDAILYFQAALRDFQAVGPGAADQIEPILRIISQLQQQ